MTCEFILKFYVKDFTPGMYDILFKLMPHKPINHLGGEFEVGKIVLTCLFDSTENCNASAKAMLDYPFSWMNLEKF